jgi:SAM-dependent methyltransferase
VVTSNGGSRSVMALEQPATRDLLPSAGEMEQLFAQKYGEAATMGWSPRRRHRYGYYLPSDVYEATVAKHVLRGGRWIDVGGGRNIFPENPELARTLVSRARHVVAVDPDPGTASNKYVHERVQCPIEQYEAPAAFDLATLRMVVEHISNPHDAVAALERFVRPGGLAIVLTVNAWSPVTLASRLTPFWLHYPVKKLLWGGDEKDTFPVEYKMNTRRVLEKHFNRHAFREVAFAYLDDLCVFGNYSFLNRLELGAWRTLHALGLTYPENCLLGIYRRN